MATPIISFRVPQNRQAVVRELVNATKDNPEELAAVLEFVRKNPASGIKAAKDKSLGPFCSAEDALQVITLRLGIALRPEAIFLFGSRARGTERPDSDFDLMVITADDRSLDLLSANRPVAGLMVPVDVVPYKLSNFEQNRNNPKTLAYTVDREGKILMANIRGPFWDRYCEACEQQ